MILFSMFGNREDLRKMELDMTKGNPLKLILQFMGPLIIGNVFQQFYSMADTIIVGNFVGVKALAAVGSTGTIMFLILGFIQGLTAGFTVLTSQRFGAADYEAMKKSVGNSIVLSIFTVVIVTIISVVFMDDLLHLMNTPADIYTDARTYILIICYGIFAIVLYNMSAGILRALGNSKAPLYFLIISAVLNIVLDIVFIKFFELGVSGAAWATVISQGVSGVLCVAFMIKKVPLLHLKLEHFRLRKRVVKIQLRIGIPMALQFSITAVGTIVVQSVLNMLGSMAVAAYTAASKLEQLVSQPFFAMGLTMATYSAQNKGMNFIKRIKKGVNLSVLITLAYAIIAGLFIVGMLPFLLPLFVKENYDVILPYARIYLIISGSCFFPLGLIFIYRNAMQGCGHSMMPMLGGVVELGSRLVIAIVAASLMSFTGVCFANGFTWVITALFLWISYMIIMRREKEEVSHDL